MDRQDETFETVKEDQAREVTEGHVKGVENAADKGQLSRKQAERVMGAGQKGTRSHDMARGITQRKD